ncbi:hypothetical protein SAMN02745245_01745 [Anaerosphaera aminiphila DSM 21120]|uniref:Uncharacterized protein n=1 Tax=Anaerosphaera aminiphila DSM 21120 TaxID=1120995 RepID=A0A1M5UFX0_9FIRM|nr:hypothetical protein [Anaerosphaera aminiphila]SHH61533.1 hypothetical protein SAMN02745245_01745 [Anaerosphaera aminiphila DSM 21120]
MSYQKGGGLFLITSVPLTIIFSLVVMPEGPSKNSDYFLFGAVYVFFSVLAVIGLNKVLAFKEFRRKKKLEDEKRLLRMKKKKMPARKRANRKDKNRR